VEQGTATVIADGLLTALREMGPNILTTSRPLEQTALQETLDAKEE
jgi:hypothetical protein